MNVGFIGLGHQGTPMAERMISAGLRPWLWARRQEVLDQYLDADAELATSPADVGANCDVIGLCLFDAGATDTVLFGDAGLMSGIRPGATLAIHATVDPNYVRDLADRVADRDVTVVDAPVSGGDVAAAAGQLLVMTGGDPDAIERCTTMFSTYAKRVVYLGGLGTAQSAKLINNALMAAISGLVIDAFELGTELGIDADGLADVLANGSAANPSVEILRAFGAEQFSIRAWPTLHKDVTLATQLAAVHGGADRPLIETAHEAISDMEVRRADYVRQREEEG